MSLRLLRRYPIRQYTSSSIGFFRQKSSSTTNLQPTDDCGIPLQPTWSVNKLLSSYPSPKLSNETVHRLYGLSALEPPKEAKEFDAVKENLEEMVKLVEAVRLVDTSSIELSGHHWEEDDADRKTQVKDQSGKRGQELLKHSSNTKDGFYVVDAERNRR